MSKYVFHQFSGYLHVWRYMPDMLQADVMWNKFLEIGRARCESTNQGFKSIVKNRENNTVYYDLWMDWLISGHSHCKSLKVLTYINLVEGYDQMLNRLTTEKSAKQSKRNPMMTIIQMPRNCFDKSHH
jgi:hypothetical protein